MNVKQIEDQIAAQFSFPEGKWSWDVKKVLSEHVLIYLHITTVEPGYILPAVWSRDGTLATWDLDSWGKFTQLIEEEKLSIADNLQDILDIFCFFQPYKRILHNVADLEFVHQEKRSLLSKYAGNITPPVCLFRKDGQQARFWTIDYGFGNLEEWLFVQKDTKLYIQSWIREASLILTLLGH